MPEALVTEAVAWIGAEIGGDIGAALIMNAAAVATAVQVASAVYTLRSQQSRSERAARDAYNASLKDRYVMVRSATDPRQMVLGRQRVSGPIGFIKSYGTKNEHLVYTVLLAAHEVDAIETIYFDDEPVVLDGAGNVTGVQRQDEYSIAAATGTFTISSTPKSGTVTAVAKYGTTITTLTVTGVTGTSVSVSGANPSATGLLVITYQPDPCPFVPNVVASTVEYFTPGANPATFTLATAPGGTVTGTQSTGTGVTQQDITITASMAGLVATFTGVTPGVQCAVSYQSAAAGYRARVRKYTGAAGQTADAAMISNLGGVWTSAHVGVGLAYLVVELDYDADSFPGGLPNVSAVVRGLKCYDPRSTTTVWTENPALLMRAYAIHPLGGRQAVAAIDDTIVSAAANVCDASLSYVIGTATFTRATYTAGLVARSGTRPSDVLNDLAQAMGGRWCMVDGTLKVKAGTYTAPVLALDASWLHEGGAVTVTPGRNRMDVINAATGTFADEASDYKVLAFPKIIAAAYVTTDGAELPVDMQMAAVTFSGQAQYIAACALRYARSALTVKLTCNLRAYQCEPFDVITVTLDRFGWLNKTMEVLDTSWTVEGGIELTLKAIDASIWAIDAAYTAGVPAANTRLPSPWDIPKVAGLSAASTAADVQKTPDGSKIGRILATWSAMSDQRVTQNGNIEVRWGLATADESAWKTEVCAGSAARVYLTPVHLGGAYIVKARTITASAASEWCAHVLCQVANTETNTALVAANAAASAASAAAGDATAALTTLANIASDSLLTPDEKPRVIMDRDVIVAEQSSIDAQATNYAVTTEKTTYDTAVTALTTYLATLTSAVQWDNLSGNTTIVGATFRAKFADVYVSRQALLDKIAANAKARLGALATLSTVDTAQIAAGAATAIPRDQGGAGDVGNFPGAGATNVNVVVRTVSWTNSTSAAVDVQIESGITDSSMSWNVGYPTGTTTATLEWSSASLSGSIVLCSKWPDMAVTSHTISPAGGYLVSLPAGETLTALLRMIVVHSAEAVIGFTSSRVVLTAIKR